MQMMGVATDHPIDAAGKQELLDFVDRMRLEIEAGLIVGVHVTAVLRLRAASPALLAKLRAYPQWDAQLKMLNVHDHVGLQMMAVDPEAVEQIAEEHNVIAVKMPLRGVH